MLSFLLFTLLQDIVASLSCSNQTIALGKVTDKNGNPDWQLSSGSYNANLNCRYQINIPRFYSAEVTVDFSGFDEFHLLSISDNYGGIISSVEAGRNASFSLEFPYPSVTITIRTGDLSSDPPTITNLTIRSIQRRPFAEDTMLPLSPQVDASFRLIPVDPAIDPTVIFLGDLTENTSLMFKSNDGPNITLHRLYYSSFDVKMQLINIHIYTYEDLNLKNFYVVGTLFAPQILSELRKEAICLFISKSVQQEIFLTVTSDQNTNYYSNWQLSYSLFSDRPIYQGPDFCLDATDGPAAYSVYSNLGIFDRFHKDDVLTNLIVTSINSSSEQFPPVKFHTTFPCHPSLMQPVYTFTGDPNQLPQKAFGNVKTFVIENGSVCISTNFNAIHGRWNIAYPKRRGFNIAQTPLRIGPLGTKEFHLFSENGTTNFHWKLSLDLSKSTLDGSRCDINYTFNNQTTSTQLLLNYSNPSALKSLEFNAERVDAVIRPMMAGTLWIDFLIEPVTSSISGHLEHILVIIVALLHLRRHLK